MNALANLILPLLLISSTGYTQTATQTNFSRSFLVRSLFYEILYPSEKGFSGHLERLGIADESFIFQNEELSEQIAEAGTAINEDIVVSALPGYGTARSFKKDPHFVQAYDKLVTSVTSLWDPNYFAFTHAENNFVSVLSLLNLQKLLLNSRVIHEVPWVTVKQLNQNIERFVLLGMKSGFDALENASRPVKTETTLGFKAALLALLDQEGSENTDINKLVKNSLKEARLKLAEKVVPGRLVSITAFRRALLSSCGSLFGE